MNEALSRRDLMKRTAGSAVGSKLGFLGRVLGQKPASFNIKNLMLAFVKDTGKIPLSLRGLDGESIGVHYYPMLRHYGVMPADIEDKDVNKVAANLSNFFGDAGIGDEFKNNWAKRKRESKWATPLDSLMRVVEKKYGNDVDRDFGEEMLRTLISTKNLSEVDVEDLLVGHKGTASKLLQMLVKSAGGTKELFKPDMRAARKLYKEYNPFIQKMWRDPETMAKGHKITKLKKALTKIPDAQKTLGLPDWMVKASQGTTHTIDPDSDFWKYWTDYSEKGKEEAEKALKTRYKPDHKTLGPWNRQGKEIGALKPGQGFGGYSSESIKCNTDAYKMLIESI